MSADDTPTTSSAVDRREALKKAAAAAGVVAWATPTVQALTPGVASAQTGVTNCVPQALIKVQFTGSVCECTKGLTVNCCSNHTFLFTGGVTSCGPNCDVVSSTVGTVVGAKIKGCPQGTVLDTGVCGGIALITIPVAVECEDGTKFNCTTQLGLPCEPSGCPSAVVAPPLTCTIVP